MASPLRSKLALLKSEEGIAMFMVISCVMILSVLGSEFTYTAQVSQRMAYNGFDTLKAHYLAKSGFKLSLLRLKAYQQVKQFTKTNKIPLPATVIEKIWNMPFMFPIPTQLLGEMNEIDKSKIEKFQKESALDGAFTTVIESESSKYNLNNVLSALAAPNPQPSPSQTPAPGSTPSPVPSFNPDEARKGLQDYLYNIVSTEFESDADFAAEYRDLKVEELADSIIAWADTKYERRFNAGREVIPDKKAPFYALSELHQVQGMDDKLYKLFAPGLTASGTQGININTMSDATLRAIVPQMTKEEREKFMEARQSEAEDNSFKTVDDFYKYLQEKVDHFRNNEPEITKLRQDLDKRWIKLVTDESQFKITATGTYYNARRTLEAWVTLLPPEAPARPDRNASATGQSPPANAPPANATQTQEVKSRLKITFMRIL